MRTKKVNISTGDFESLPPLLTFNEAGAVIHVHGRTVDRWAKSGRIRYIKVTATGSGKKLIRRSELARFIAEAEGCQ